MTNSIKVLYLSTAVTPQDMVVIEKNKIEGTSNGYVPIYKYHNAIIEGLNQTNELDITSVIVPPITNRTSSLKVFKGNEFISNNVRYKTIGFINNRIAKYISVLLKIPLAIASWYRSDDNRKRIIIIDGAFISAIIPWQIMRLFHRIPTIFIIADVYDFMHPNKKKTLLNRFYGMILKKVEGFAFITKHTNDLMNVNNKPFLLVEGIVNPSYIPTINNNKEKFFMYAGSLHEQNGIGKLVEAFSTLDTDYKLKIYGSGDLEEYIKKVSDSNEKILFMGVKPLNEILIEETKASFLVNPRPIHEEFTKYSFPSKTIEYLLSGTPLLSSKLPGIPEEYDKYINYINVDSVEQIRNDLEIVLNNSYESYMTKAFMAREWLIKNKSSKSVGKKFLNVIKQTIQ